MHGVIGNYAVAFSLIGRHWRQLAATVGLLAAPLMALRLATWVKPIPNVDLTPAQMFGSPGRLVLEVVSLFAGVFTAAALAQLTADAQSGRDVSWRRAWSESLRRARPVLTAGFAMRTMIMLCLLPVAVVVGLMAVPFTGSASLSSWVLPVAMGVSFMFMSAWFAYVVPAATLEGSGGFDALARNKHLRAGTFWTLFWTLAPLEMLLLVPTLLGGPTGGDSLWASPAQEAWTRLVSVPVTVMAVVLFQAGKTRTESQGEAASPQPASA